MLRVVITGVSLVLILLSAACKMELRAYEGQGCSTSSGDDPHYTCTPQYDLVCIATWSQVITKERVAKRFDGGARDVYQCRQPCSPDAGRSGCQSDEVCCTGRIHGFDYGKTGGCTLAMFCDNLAGAATDGGPRTTGDAARGVGSDASRDSIQDAPDAGVDASSD